MKMPSTRVGNTFSQIGASLPRGTSHLKVPSSRVDTDWETAGNRKVGHWETPASPLGLVVPARTSQQPGGHRP